MGYRGERLVEGLNHDERLARLETRVLGNGLKAPGLELEHDRLLQRVEELEHRENRRALPFFLRWFVPASVDRRPWKEKKSS